MDKKLISFCSMVTLSNLAVPALTHAQENTDKVQHPNIILFMVDDMGWQDTSVPFWTQRTPYNDAYETPNMERLAS